MAHDKLPLKYTYSNYLGEGYTYRPPTLELLGLRQYNLSLRSGLYTVCSQSEGLPGMNSRNSRGTCVFYTLMTLDARSISLEFVYFVFLFSLPVITEALLDGMSRK